MYTWELLARGHGTEGVEWRSECETSYQMETAYGEPFMKVLSWGDHGLDTETYGRILEATKQVFGRGAD